MATAYAEAIVRMEMVNNARKLAIATANSALATEEKPALKREGGLDMKALERFRKTPVKKEVRMGSVTTSEDGFSDDEDD